MSHGILNNLQPTEIFTINYGPHYHKCRKLNSTYDTVMMKFFIETSSYILPFITHHLEYKLITESYLHRKKYKPY